MSNAHASRSPHFIAQLAKADRLVTEQFESWGLTDPDQRATYLLRRLRTELEWAPPRTAADDPHPPRRPDHCATPEQRAEHLATIRATLTGPRS